VALYVFGSAEGGQMTAQRAQDDENMTAERAQNDLNIL